MIIITIYKQRGSFVPHFCSLGSPGAWGQHLFCSGEDPLLLQLMGQGNLSDRKTHCQGTRFTFRFLIVGMESHVAQAVLELIT